MRGAAKLRKPQLPVQLELQPRTWGGRRAGAGRKPAAGRRNVAHGPRGSHSHSHPVHVTMRAHRLVPWLRSQRVTTRIVHAIAKASRGGFRILQFSVQGNHVHLLVEATDRTRLGRGLQGLAIRIARQVNGLLKRRGAFWGDRYHARALRTPREVRNALVYVLMNVKKHARQPPVVDPCSSAPWFDGWANGAAGLLEALHPRGSPLLALERPPIAAPRTWLARTGWRRHGRLRPHDAPPRAGEVRSHR